MSSGEWTYLDWAASAPPDPVALEEALEISRNCFGNPSSPHGVGKTAERKLVEARERFARAVQAKPSEIVFTSGGSESNALVLLSLIGRQRIGTVENRPPRVVVSAIEHASVYEQARLLEGHGIRCAVVRPRAGGIVDPQDVVDALDDTTQMVSVMLVNNETGAIQRIPEIAQALSDFSARDGRRILLHTDAVQALGKIPLSVKALGADAASFSGHKIGAPRGVGALWIRDGVSPVFLSAGGEQEGGRRPGTENLGGIAAMAIALERRVSGMQQELARARENEERLLAGLAAMRGARIFPEDRRGRTLLALHRLCRLPAGPCGGRRAGCRCPRILHLDGGRVLQQEERPDPRPGEHGALPRHRPLRHPDLYWPFHIRGPDRRVPRRAPPGDGRPSGGSREPHRLMERLFLVKYGEIALKKRNRGAFVRSLKDSVRAKLPGVPVHVWETFHRVFVRYETESRERIIESLARTFGVVSFSDALRVDNEMPQIEDAARELARGFMASGLGARFKAEVRRAEKSFPLTSYQIACRIGDVLLSAVPGLTVDVHDPDWVLNVEIRERAYLYGRRVSGPGGTAHWQLREGAAAPVRRNRLARGWIYDGQTRAGHRGGLFPLSAFHLGYGEAEGGDVWSACWPGMSPASSCTWSTSHPSLGRIRERSRPEETTLLLRACMMEFSCLLAARRAAACLVTGESLGQVASQTVESMHFTGSLASLPVLRPLVGMNKEEIITVARSLGTFDISNLPYPDCCVLFSPEHPLIHPDVDRMTRAYQKLDVGTFLSDALSKVDTVSQLTGAGAT